MQIIKSTKKAGVHTNKVDPEPYFFRWNAVIPMGSKDQPELVGQPCYQHKTCGHLVLSPHDRVPPIVCRWCGGDTVKEAIEKERYEKQGVAWFDFPSHIVTLKEATFGRFSRIFRSD